MAEWYVTGPIEVPIIFQGLARFIDEARIDDLCEVYSQMLETGGVYVFGARSGGGIMPIYVGMTETRKIKEEAFNHKNCNNINKYINGKKCTLVLFTITRVRSPGKRNVSDIREIEYLLIGQAESRNPELINIQTPGEDSWSIKGVHRSRGGRRDQSTKDFRRMMGHDSSSRATQAADPRSETDERPPALIASEEVEQPTDQVP